MLESLNHLWWNENTLSFQLNFQLKILLDLFILFFFSFQWFSLSCPSWRHRAVAPPIILKNSRTRPPSHLLSIFPHQVRGSHSSCLLTLRAPVKAEFTFSPGAGFWPFKLYLHYTFHEEEFQTAVPDYLHRLKSQNDMAHSWLVPFYHLNIS